MEISQASKRYAAAFYKRLEEKQKQGKVLLDMNVLIAFCQKSPSFTELISSTAMPMAKKRALFYKLFHDKLDSETMRFLNFLLSKSREALIHSIAQFFLNLYEEKKGIVKVSLFLGHPLGRHQENFTKVLQQKITKLLGKQIELSVHEKPELIAGFTLHIADIIYNASLKRQIEILREDLLAEAG